MPNAKLSERTEHKPNPNAVLTGTIVYDLSLDPSFSLRCRLRVIATVANTQWCIIPTVNDHVNDSVYQCIKHGIQRYENTRIVYNMVQQLYHLYALFTYAYSSAMWGDLYWIICGSNGFDNPWYKLSFSKRGRGFHVRADSQIQLVSFSGRFIVTTFIHLVDTVLIWIRRKVKWCRCGGICGLEFDAGRVIGPINIIQNAWIVIYFGLVCGNEFIPFADDWRVY